MKNVILLVFFAFLSFPFFSVEYLHIYTLSDETGRDIRLRFDVGEKYSSSFKFDIFDVVIRPQIAVWLEDEAGNFIKTLYVTQTFASQNWLAIIKLDKRETYRKEVLPCWYHRYFKKTGLEISHEKPLPDSITSATPFANFFLNTKIPEDKDYFIFVEINMALDENKDYPLKAGFGNPNINGVSGQPALVYKGKISKNDASEVTLQLIGRSCQTGKDDTIYTDVDKITSAFKIINKIVVSGKKSDNFLRMFY